MRDDYTIRYIEQMLFVMVDKCGDDFYFQEDLLTLKNAAYVNDPTLAATKGLASARGLTSQSSSPLSLNTTNIFIAVAMVIVGYLLGKMF